MVKLGKKEQQKYRTEGYDLDFISSGAAARWH